jgi:hypothetical protein
MWVPPRDRASHHGCFQTSWLAVGGPRLTICAEYSALPLESKSTSSQTIVADHLLDSLIRGA